MNNSLPFSFRGEESLQIEGQRSSNNELKTQFQQTLNVMEERSRSRPRNSAMTPSLLSASLGKGMRKSVAGKRKSVGVSSRIKNQNSDLTQYHVFDLEDLNQSRVSFIIEGAQNMDKSTQMALGEFLKKEERMEKKIRKFQIDSIRRQSPKVIKSLNMPLAMNFRKTMSLSKNESMALLHPSPLEYEEEIVLPLQN